MPEVPEYVVNVKLAEILSQELGIDARAERIKGRRRPDIRCYYRGLIIGIEASYSKSDAEKDAKKRIEQGLVDIALALWIKKPYKDVPEQQLYEAIRSSRFDVKIFVPIELVGTLIPFIEKGIKKKAEPVTGWFTDIDLPTLKNIIENSVEFLVREEEVARLLSEVREKIGDFIKTLAALDSRGAIRRKIYDTLYKLYGLSVAEAEEPEVAYGHAALSILLSVTFYEHVRARHPELEPLSKYVRSYGYLEGFRRALEDLLKIDYRTAIETTLNIINVLPPNVEYRVRELIDLGIKLASNSSLLRKDFAGRIYHEITGDIALRKGFATFYTEVPAAYLLASLAVLSLLDLDRRDILKLSQEEAHKIIDRIKNVKIGDLACGSGTLLTASYSALMRLATMLKYYHGLEDVDIDEIGKVLIEEGIYGIDALRYASQITAINLALIGPSNITKENIYTIYLGYIPSKNQAWLGSLELLNNAGRVGGLLAYIEGGLRGAVERTTLEGTEGTFSIPSKFDIVIMNPPFTRATGRTEKFGKGRGLFGFIVDEPIRQKLLESFKRVRDRVRNDLRSIARSYTKLFPDIIKNIISGDQEFRSYLDIGQAGEGLLFLYLAYKYTKDNGVIAFVLPRGLLAGISWFLARVLLATKFHVKYVIVSSDPARGYNFSEGTSLSETLIVAKKTKQHSDEEETVFINLLHKPSSALEAIMLVEAVKKATEKGGVFVSTCNGGAIAMITKVKRRELLENIDNWNRLIAFPDYELNKMVIDIVNGKILELDRSVVKIPIIRLGNIAEVVGLAVRRGTFHDVFKQIPSKVPDAIPALIGGDERFRVKILVKPNSWVVTTKREYLSTASKFLVPDRIWVDTTHAIALYSEEPIVANMFFGLKPKNNSIGDKHFKALILWLNTTWGLLTILAERTETRGRWIELTKLKWKLLPVLNIASLDFGTIDSLVKVFEKYVDKPLKRIPDQFDPNNPDPIRLGIDKEFIKAFKPSLDDKVIEDKLRELYKHVYAALKQWIGE